MQTAVPRATRRGEWLLLGLGPLAGATGELGWEFPCRLVPFHLKQMSGCWGLASGTFLALVFLALVNRGQTALLRISAGKTSYS